MTIPIYEPLLSQEEKRLLEKINFKITKTTHISTSRYTGNVLWYQLPNSFSFFKTNDDAVYTICENFKVMATVKYVISPGQLAIFLFINSNVD